MSTILRVICVLPVTMREGRLKVKEDHADGLENAPNHFLKLMRGENIGKAIVAVGSERA